MNNRIKRAIGKELLANDFDNTVILHNDKGKDMLFEFLDLVEHKDKEFLVLWPEGCEEKGLVEIVEISNDENTGEEIYLPIADEKILREVFEIFRNRLIDALNECEDECGCGNGRHCGCSGGCGCGGK